MQGMLKVLQEWGPKVILEVDDADEMRCDGKLNACRKFLEDLQYKIEVLPKSYKDGGWFVRHLVARHDAPLTPSDDTHVMDSSESQ